MNDLSESVRVAGLPATPSVARESVDAKPRRDLSALAKQLAPWLCLLPAILFLCLFFVGPVLLNLNQSLQGADSTALGIGNYRRILTDSYYWEVGLQTLLLGGGVTMASLLLGYPMAYAIARCDGALKVFLILVLVTPLLVNVVVRSYGWMVLLGGGGVIDSILQALGFPKFDLMYSWTGIAIALVHVLLPFMVLAIASALETVDPTLEHAAQISGASAMKTFWYVTLPLSMEGVVTGSIMTFTLTIGSFVTVMLLGDNRTMVLPLLIYQKLTVTSDWAAAASLGIVLLVVVTTLLWLQGRLRRPINRS